MDSLRQLTEVFKNHYEKILLSAVLLALALAVVFVYRASQRAEQDVENSVADILGKKPKPVAPVDLSPAETVLKLHQAPPDIIFSAPHNLVNPVKWKRRPTGELYKMPPQEEIGWGKMFITRMTPLIFRVSLDKIPNPGGYFIGFLNEAADDPRYRRKFSPYLKINETNKTVPRHLVLREIRGPQEKPDELVIEFVDNGEKIVVTPDKPFERIEGYEVDLRHEITGQTFTKLRVGSPVKMLDEDYIIVAINQNEVVASARANEKTYAVRQVAPPTNGTAKATQPVPTGQGSAPPVPK